MMFNHVVSFPADAPDLHWNEEHSFTQIRCFLDSLKLPRLDHSVDAGMIVFH